MLVIPDRIKQKLEQDQLLFGEVNSTIASFTPWFVDNKLTFFPEYTDHGVNHLQEVLNTAASMITDDSWELITAQDAAAVILSTLLHDCAMHLSEDGFYELISNEYPKLESRYYNEEQSWNEKWREFISTAKRWDGKKLKSIFGDSNPIKEIPNSKIDLNNRDKLLIGEFLRREHANIAHSIALLGVPGNSKCRLKLAVTDYHICDLVGFIAKSHNLSLRSATDMLPSTQKRTAFNIHAPFIMGVLRVSDYIQVHSSRADRQLLSVKKLISPISRGEWKKHHSILDINQTHEDPEALYIEAEPQEPITYKSLKLLFSDIQKELDSVWSVLGEVYGRFIPYDKLGINIRRIRSSLDNEIQYIKEKKPCFIPSPVKFKTSDAEMLSLLVAPLYGNNPSIGIRELVQNAVDACNERIDYQDKTVCKEYLSEADINVSVKIDKRTTERSTISIVDTGIGMNKTVIEDYFLNIGASFRNSDTWKKMHETDGHSTVHRTGRFGIGLLAAFLLGEEIHVQTRHINEKNGISFKCTKDSEDISLIPVECEVGTTITVFLNDEVCSKLIKGEQTDWDWYCLEQPKVTRSICSEDTVKLLEQKITVPSSGAILDNTSWHRIEHKEFDDIYWSPHKLIRSQFSHTKLICNGIYIPLNHYPSYKIENYSTPLNIQVITPSLVVFDQEGKMPINLTRDGITSDFLPFNNELLLDLAIHLCDEIYEKFYTQNKPLSSELISELFNHKLIYGAPKNYFSDEILPFIFHKGKVHPSNVNLISSLKPELIILDQVSPQDTGNCSSCTELMTPDSLYSFYDVGRRSRASKVQYLRFIFHRDHYRQHLPVIGKRLIIKNDEIKDILTPGNFPKTVWAKLTPEWTDNNWTIMKVGNTPDINWSITNTLISMENVGQSMLSILYLDWNNEFKQPEPSILAEVWAKKIK